MLLSWLTNQAILRVGFCAVGGLAEAWCSRFTARFRHSGEARHIDTEGVSSSRGKARQKALGANGGVLEGRPVLQHVDGVELRLEHSGAR